MKLTNPLNSAVFLIALCLFTVLGSVSVAALPECSGTLSGPSTNVFTGDQFQVTFFNAHTGSAGENLTLATQGNATITPAVHTSIAQFTSYSWNVTFNDPFSGVLTAQINNTCEKNFTVSIVDPVADPNITISIASIPQLTKGSSATINVNISNDASAGNATNITGKALTSQTYTITPSAFSIADLDAGQVTQQTYTFTPTQCGNAQSFTVQVDEHYDDSGEAQGSKTQSATFNVAGSDLEITVLSAAPANASEGTAVTLSASVRNSGSVTSSASTVTFYANSVGGTVLGTASVPALAPNQVHLAQTTWTATPGVTTIVAQVVASGSEECLTTNNDRTGNSVNISGSSSGGSGTSGGSSGGGSGGGGYRGTTYTLDVEGITSADLVVRSQDRVNIIFEGQTYTLNIPFVARDEVLFTMSNVNKREYVKMGSTWNVDLNIDLEEDIAITPHDYSGGKVTLTFKNLAIPQKPDYSNIPLIGTFIRGLLDKEDQQESASPEQGVGAQGTLEIEESVENASSPLARDVLVGFLTMIGIVAVGLGAYFYWKQSRFEL